MVTVNFHSVIRKTGMQGCQEIMQGHAENTTEVSSLSTDLGLVHDLEQCCCLRSDEDIVEQELALFLAECTSALVNLKQIATHKQGEKILNCNVKMQKKQVNMP